ncbi:protocatechuate 3,4-dioxygenase subunit beta [Streptomyces sp. SRF1]|uniref:dioxygenase family protein n=1 Tax=Streptomyces sp. SRF1 TaxID=1549642 RepID=UPI0025B201FC|nr:protocatechuate 3,4-dioxygenase subunit beta [Streptomyces sp. SRF1]MDN3060993.1 protocatechuate 3,4-dioxygenase subunit beta [Streptomyces sp. SRF1]
MSELPTQERMTQEIDASRESYRRALASGAARRVHPDRDYVPYRSSGSRHPRHPLVSVVDPGMVELTGPAFGVTDVSEWDHDLTRGHPGEPIGERLTVTGRVLDRAGRPVGGQLVEIWQANAAGRYAHRRDQHAAPLDPNFTGVGRCLTSADGVYRFVTARPGAYPWRNHHNAWRPAHIHFSLFGTAFTQRLVTRMYFRGDPHDDVTAVQQLGQRGHGCQAELGGARCGRGAAPGCAPQDLGRVGRGAGRDGCAHAAGVEDADGRLVHGATPRSR